MYHLMISRLVIYRSPLIVAIDRPFIDAPTQTNFDSISQELVTPKVVTSAVVVAVKKQRYLDLMDGHPQNTLLARIQSFPVAYMNNTATNNSTDIISRILTLEMIPPRTLIIIIYDSTVVHKHHMSLGIITHTQYHLK